MAEAPQDYDELVAVMEDLNYDGLSVQPRIFNQPTLITVNSSNGETEGADGTAYNGTGYYNFKVNLPRPALEVDTLQLLSCNIPQANANIPNTACVFWYYRLSAYSGNVPNPNNLFMVRLLPSYYKPEFIANSNDYGFNRTFKTYKDLATELVKSCANDIAFTNNQIVTSTTSYNVPFLPSDISLTYNSGINKFQMIGNPTNPVYTFWSAGTYGLNEIVAREGVAYQSKITGNTTAPPSTSWTTLYSTEVVAPWDKTTVYPAGRYVSYNNTIYVSLSTNIYATPNGIIPPWVSGNTYYFGELVLYSGTVYTATATSSGITPPSSGPFYPTIWQSYTPYVTGFVCDYEGSYYVALQTATGKIPSTNPTYWRIAGPNGWFWVNSSLPPSYSPTVYNYLSTGYNDPNVAVAQSNGVQTWNPYNLYETLQTVSYNGASYTNDYQSQNEAPFNTSGATITSGVMTGTTVIFQAANNFSVGQLVNIQTDRPRVNGSYRIIECNSSSFTVANSVAKSSSPITGSVSYPTFQIVGAWSSSTEYTQFSIVSYGGQYYSAKNPNTNVAPDDPTEFAPGITEGQIYWNPLGTTLYQLNDVVLYSSTYYRAFQSVTDLNQFPAPTNSSWIRSTWIPTTTAPPITGLSQISAALDNIEIVTLGGSQAIFNPFPYSIPPQPYNATPKRLLNSILGFTWNGQMTPSLFAGINQPTFTFILQQYAPLFNRLRPVPLYLTGTTVSISGLTNSTTSYTYTADGYCNLVYSSTISIYSTVVGASSVDTLRDTSLLALISMNCGNLGLSSWASFIDNPLTKVKGDIYSIYVELRDEFGEPYFLTNNAVASLEFKIGYKAGIKIG